MLLIPIIKITIIYGEFPKYYTVQSDLHLVFLLIIILKEMGNYYLPFTNERTEAHRD